MSKRTTGKTRGKRIRGRSAHGEMEDLLMSEADYRKEGYKKRKALKERVKRGGSQTEQEVIESFQGYNLTPPQVKFLKLYLRNYSNTSEACRKMGLSLSTEYEWRTKRDNRFDYIKAKKLCDEALTDYAESKLRELIGERNAQAVIFFLKTRGKDRGYVERTEINLVQVREHVVDLATKFMEIITGEVKDESARHRIATRLDEAVQQYSG